MGFLVILSGIHGDKGSFHTDISDLCVVFIAIG